MGRQRPRSSRSMDCAPLSARQHDQGVHQTTRTDPGADGKAQGRGEEACGAAGEGPARGEDPGAGAGEGQSFLAGKMKPRAVGARGCSREKVSHEVTNSTMNGVNATAKRDTASPYGEADLAALRTEALMVTPAMAKMLRASCHFERQRPINARNVERLAMEMRRGWFITGTPVFMAVLPDGSMRIVNGNHTLEAVQSSGVSIPLAFIYSKVSDIEGAARIYACLDLQK